MIRDNEPGEGFEIAEVKIGRQRVAVIARRLVVQLADVETLDDEAKVDDVVSQALASLPEGTTVVRGPSPTGRLVVTLPPGDDSGKALERTKGAVAKNAVIAYVEPDVVDTIQLVPNDPRYPQQWAPPAVNAPGAWDLEQGNSNVLIGIIDSGISMTGASLDHDDLDDAGRITLGTDFVDGGVPRDLNGHGTHVAGIAAATGNNAAGIAGMNWASPVYITRTLDANGNGSGADFADAVEEITDAAVARGIHAVINYSGGGAASATKLAACQYASNHGMLVVAAAGNDNGGPVIFPAAYSTTVTGVIAVGSTDQGDVVSSFSNVGPEVTVVAPGRSIMSTLPTYSTGQGLPLSYGSLSGTSMATPLVTGLAALMWSRHPGHTNAKIKECLQDTAVKLGAGSFDNAWGHGRVDAYAALKCGDLVIKPTTLKVFCPPSRLTLCKSVIRVCPSVLTRCPSDLTLTCRSRLPNLCRTEINVLCGEIISAVKCPTFGACPSAVDACPSSLGCEVTQLCGFPGDVTIDPGILRGPALGRVAGLAARLEAAGSVQQPLFYVDDDGTVHEV